MGMFTKIIFIFNEQWNIESGVVQLVRNGKIEHFDPPTPYVTVCNAWFDTTLFVT